MFWNFNLQIGLVHVLKRLMIKSLEQKFLFSNDKDFCFYKYFPCWCYIVFKTMTNDKNRLKPFRNTSIYIEWKRSLNIQHFSSLKLDLYAWNHDCSLIIIHLVSKYFLKWSQYSQCSTLVLGMSYIYYNSFTS